MQARATPLFLCAYVLASMLILVTTARATKAATIPTDYGRFSVADFGATPDDGKDDTRAVSKAIQACVARPGSALLFPKGRYDFARDQRVGRSIYQLVFKGGRGLIIDGQGSHLIFRGKTAAFRFEDCEDVRVTDLTIDWNEPLFSAGVITRAESRFFDVALDREYSGEGSDRIESVIEFDAETRLPFRGGRDIHDLPGARDPIIRRFEKIGPRAMRVHLSRDRRMDKGAYAILRHQVYVYNGFTIDRCKRMTLQDVTIHYAPGMGIAGRRTEDILLERVRLVPRPNSGRILSTSSDGTHFSACSGTIRIEDCTFQGMGDDATNIHGYYLDVVGLVDERTLDAKCKNTWIWPPAVGNAMEFTDPVSLVPFGTGTVTSVEIFRKTRVHRIAFAAPVPKGVRAGTFLANATRTPRARISGNRVVGNRARGFVIKTRDALVENNTFDSVSGSAIFVATEGDHWRESIGTREVVIRGNVIRNCNGGPSRRWAAISVFALTEGYRQGAAGVHKTLTIERNTIEGTDNAGIFVAAADGVTLRQNVISNCSRQPSRPGGDCAVYLTKCRNVTIRGNVLKDPGPGFRKGIATGPGAEKSTLTVEANTGF